MTLQKCFVVVCTMSLLANATIKASEVPLLEKTSSKSSKASSSPSIIPPITDELQYQSNLATILKAILEMNTSTNLVLRNLEATDLRIAGLEDLLQLVLYKVNDQMSMNGVKLSEADQITVDNYRLGITALKGSSYGSRVNVKRAEQLFEYVISQSSTSNNYAAQAGAHRYLAQIFYDGIERERNLDAAKDHCDAAVKLIENQRRVNDAIEDVAQLNKIDEEIEAFVHYLLGRIAWEGRNSEIALVEFDKSDTLTKDPELKQSTNYFLGEVYAYLELIEKAISAYDCSRFNRKYLIPSCFYIASKSEARETVCSRYFNIIDFYEQTEKMEAENPAKEKGFKVFSTSKGQEALFRAYCYVGDAILSGSSTLNNISKERAMKYLELAANFDLRKCGSDSNVILDLNVLKPTAAKNCAYYRPLAIKDSSKNQGAQ